MKGVSCAFGVPDCGQHGSLAAPCSCVCDFGWTTNTNQDFSNYTYCSIATLSREGYAPREPFHPQSVTSCRNGKVLRTCKAFLCGRPHTGLLTHADDTAKHTPPHSNLSIRTEPVAEVTSSVPAPPPGGASPEASSSSSGGLAWYEWVAIVMGLLALALVSLQVVQCCRDRAAAGRGGSLLTSTSKTATELLLGLSGKGHLSGAEVGPA